MQTVAALRRRVWELLYESRSIPARLVKLFLASLILISVAVLMLETVPEIRRDHGPLLEMAEWLAVGIFTVEYVLRVWVAVEEPRFARPVVGRLRYCATPLALLDLAAILPSYLPFLLSGELRALRLVRLLRVLAILRMGRYSVALRTLGAVLWLRRGELGAVVALVLVLLLLSASAMYVIEHEENPNFGSIPEALWWGIITLTTIGYGDAYPVTAVGRLLGGFVALLGIGIVALPAGILASGFQEELARQKAARSAPEDSGGDRCPHCGKPLPERSGSALGGTDAS